MGIKDDESTLTLFLPGGGGAVGGQTPLVVFLELLGNREFSMKLNPKSSEFQNFWKNFMPFSAEINMLKFVKL